MAKTKPLRICTANGEYVKNPIQFNSISFFVRPPSHLFSSSSFPFRHHYRTTLFLCKLIVCRRNKYTHVSWCGYYCSCFVLVIDNNKVYTLLFYLHRLQQQQYATNSRTKPSQTVHITLHTIIFFELCLLFAHWAPYCLFVFFFFLCIYSRWLRLFINMLLL